MICPIALTRPIAPNTSPISPPFPIACKLTAPSEYRAGFPPDVIEFIDVKKMKRAWDDVGDRATRAFADASMKKEIAVTR
jgi:hypothetical protein